MEIEALTLNKWKRKITEDELLTEDVLRLISYLHGKIYRIYKHFREKKKEIDVIIHTKTTEQKLDRYIGTIRIGVELKEKNTIKVVQQAIERRDLFNYFYIITRENEYIGYRIKQLYKLKLLNALLDEGIGWIVLFSPYTYNSKFSFNEKPLMIFPSKFLAIPNLTKWLRNSRSSR
ncbi:MAG: hypothetical protein ACTSXD_12420 [Candidatus Heimdallarchaeaceae archaeon]